MYRKHFRKVFEFRNPRNPPHCWPATLPPSAPAITTDTHTHRRFGRQRRDGLQFLLRCDPGRRVEHAGPGFRCSPLATTIGGGSSKSYLGVTTVIFNFNGVGTNQSMGNDTIVLTKLNLTGGVTINTGDGNNFYGLGAFNNSDNAVFDTSVNSNLGALTLGQGLTINMGNGDDTFRASQVTLNGAAGQNLGINAGQATTTISMDHTSVAHLAAFNVSADQRHP